MSNGDRVSIQDMVQPEDNLRLPLLGPKDFSVFFIVAIQLILIPNLL